LCILAAGTGLPHKGRVTSQETETPATDFACHARFVAFCFIVFFAALAAWSAAEKRQSRETFEKISAVGDAPSYQIPDPFDPAAVVVSLKGCPLYFAAKPKAEIQDTKMRREGVADASTVVVYRCLDKKEEKAFFLKTGLNQYVRLGTKPKAK
jgi:hypothetical protein